MSGSWLRGLPYGTAAENDAHNHKAPVTPFTKTFKQLGRADVGIAGGKDVDFIGCFHDFLPS